MQTNPDPARLATWHQVLAGQPTQSAVLAHLGHPASEEIVVRPLGWRGLLTLRLGDLLQAIEPADLAGCLAQHPRQAMQFLLGRLDLGREPVIAAKHIDAAARRSVSFRYDPAPDEFPDRVPTHVIVSPVEVLRNA